MSPSPRTRPWPPLGRFAGYAAAALALAALFALAWQLRGILMLAFGAVVVAAIIRAMARPAIRRYPKREQLAILGVVLVLVLVISGIAWLFGRHISEQVHAFGERLPEAVAAAKGWVEQHPTGRFVLEKLRGTGAGEAGGSGGMTGNVTHAVTEIINSIGHALMMLVAGIYLAVDPRLYVNGLTRLFPPNHREKMREALHATGDALQRWLLGQFISMATIGTLTTAGLALVGCPVPLALGLLASLLVFVPVIGFLVAFVPTVLIALSESPQVALAAVVVFLVVQQLEEQVVQPLAQKWATALPPALGLLALAAAGLLFGLPGLIFGAPLTVVIMRLVQKLYLENGIEKRRA